MACLTLYALWGDDIRLAFTEKVTFFIQNSDSIFYSISVVCLFFFSVEIIISSRVKPNYWLGFFFWLDIVSTLSLIPDIGWLWDPIMGTGGPQSNATQTTQLARAGRASRAGTRAGRVIRIIRLIRLLRIVKLYKLSQINKEQQDTRQQQFYNYPSVQRSSITHDEDKKQDPKQIEQTYFNRQLTKLQEELQLDDTEIPEESRVGQKLSELTTKRVIVLVLAMMFGLQLFNTDTYYPINNSYKYGLEVIQSFLGQGQYENALIAYDSYIQLLKNERMPLIHIEIDNFYAGIQNP